MKLVEPHQSPSHFSFGLRVPCCKKSIFYVLFKLYFDSHKTPLEIVKQAVQNLILTFGLLFLAVDISMIVAFFHFHLGSVLRLGFRPLSLICQGLFLSN